MNYPTLSRLVAESVANREGCLDDRMLSQPEDIAIYLQENASQWLSASNNGQIVAYRGIKESPCRTKGFIAAPRQDRENKDTPKVISDLLDKVYADRGLATRRSNMLFVSNAIKEAREYGDVHAIIPLGPFEFTWFGLVSDIFGTYSGSLYSMSFAFDDIPDDVAAARADWIGSKSFTSSGRINWLEHHPYLDWLPHNVDLHVGDLVQWSSRHAPSGGEGWEGGIYCQRYVAIPKDKYEEVQRHLK